MNSGSGWMPLRSAPQEGLQFPPVPEGLAELLRTPRVVSRSGVDAEAEADGVELGSRSGSLMRWALLGPRRAWSGDCMLGRCSSRLRGSGAGIPCVACRPPVWWPSDGTTATFSWVFCPLILDAVGWESAFPSLPKSDEWTRLVSSLAHVFREARISKEVVADYILEEAVHPFHVTGSRQEELIELGQQMLLAPPPGGRKKSIPAELVRGRVARLVAGELPASVQAAPLVLEETAVEAECRRMSVASGPGCSQLRFEHLDAVFGVGGAEVCVHLVQALLGAFPTWFALQLDCKNAFNTVDRRAIHCLLYEDFPELLGLTENIRLELNVRQSIVFGPSGACEAFQDVVDAGGIQRCLQELAGSSYPLGDAAVALGQLPTRWGGVELTSTQRLAPAGWLGSWAHEWKRTVVMFPAIKELRPHLGALEGTDAGGHPLVAGFVSAMEGGCVWCEGTGAGGESGRACAAGGAQAWCHPPSGPRGLRRRDWVVQDVLVEMLRKVLLHTAAVEERRKVALYGDVNRHLLVPFAGETFRSLGEQANKFLEECTGGPARAGAYLSYMVYFDFKSYWGQKIMVALHGAQAFGQMKTSFAAHFGAPPETGAALSAAQVGVGMHGGAEACVHSVQAVLGAFPSWCGQRTAVSLLAGVGLELNVRKNVVFSQSGARKAFQHVVDAGGEPMPGAVVPLEGIWVLGACVETRDGDVPGDHQRVARSLSLDHRRRLMLVDTPSWRAWSRRWRMCKECESGCWRREPADIHCAAGGAPGRASRMPLHSAAEKEWRKVALDVSLHPLVPFAVEAFGGFCEQAKKFLEECASEGEAFGLHSWALADFPQ
eukprot:gene3395-biopygen3351